MLTPGCPSVTRTFHPFGDTPAVCLTEHIPPDRKGEEKEPINILLLGSGDIRNVLFTAHMENERRLDITCCDVDRLVLARNILLLTLLIDPDHDPSASSSGSPSLLPYDPPTSDDLFDIYYHQHIPEKLSTLVLTHAMRLRLLSATMSTWNASPYGHGRGFQQFWWAKSEGDNADSDKKGTTKGKGITKGKGKGKQPVKGTSKESATKGDPKAKQPNPNRDASDDVNPRNPASGIRFTDSGSLKLLSEIWRYWFGPTPESDSRGSPIEGLFTRVGKAAMKREEEGMGHPYNDTRSAACSYRASMPVGLEATSHATWLNNYYWRCGRTYSDVPEGYIEIADLEPLDTDESTDTDPDLEETIKQKKKDAKGKGKEKEKEKKKENENEKEHVHLPESSKQAQERQQGNTEKMPTMTYRRVNSLFFTPSPGIRINHSADPLQGFHLAPGYLPIVGQPPPKEGESQMQRLLNAAKQEFANWCDSFRCAWREGRITLRFFVGDALSFAHTLQHHKATALGNPADPGFGNWYRFRDSFDPLILDSDDYRPVPSKSHRRQAPVSFHVIDTSSLADDLGALNVLIATSPLLENRLAATLYTEHTLPLPRPSNSEDERLGPKTPHEVADTLLHGDLLTMSLLLGLSPVDYYTNTYPTSPPPTFSSPYASPFSISAPPTFPKPTPPPHAPPDTSAASSSTLDTTTPVVAQFFNQRLTWKRPVYHDPTDGTGKEWTDSNNKNIWPGTSPSLREELEAFRMEAKKHQDIYQDLIQHCRDLAAEELEEEKEISEGSKGIAKGKAKKKEKKSQKKLTTKEEHMEDLEFARNLRPEVRKKAIEKWEFEELELKKRNRKLQDDIRSEKERWEKQRKEMPLQKIRFQAKELVEFLSRVYSQMYESKYLFERKDDGERDGAGDARGGAGTAFKSGGAGFRLLSPRTCNRATFASLLKIIQQRVQIIGEPLKFPDPSDNDEFMGPMDFAMLNEMLKASQSPDAEFVQTEFSKIMAAAIGACQTTADPSIEIIPRGNSVLTSVPTTVASIDSHDDSAATPSSYQGSNIDHDESDPYDPSSSPINFDPDSFEEDSLDSDESDSSYPSTIIASSTAPSPPRQATTWDRTLDYMLETLKHSLINYVETQGTFDQEFAMVLHHFGAHSSSEHAITDPDGLIKSRTYNNANEAVLNPGKFQRRLRNWVDIPSSLAVTLRIPRHRLATLQTILLGLETGLSFVGPDPTGRENCFRKVQTYAPALQACFRPTVDLDGEPATDVPGYLFSSLQMGFGELEIKGRLFTPRFRLSIRQDPLGWEGESDLFVSFMIPTSVLMMDPENGILTVEIVPTSGPDVARRNELSFMAPGVLKKDLKIFEAHLSFDPFVFISQHMPNQNGVTKMCGFPRRPQD